MLDILKEDREQRQAGVEQQAENARYLQELNKASCLHSLDVVCETEQECLQWLETFVNNGTSQIQMVVSGVDQLCREVTPQCSEQNATPAGKTGGLRSDVKELTSAVKDNNEKSLALQAMLTEAIETAKSFKGQQKEPGR